MAAEFEVTGADDFLRLSKALKAAGRTQMRKDLTNAMKKAAKPLIVETKAEARRTLPQRGGLAKLVAKAPQRVKVATGKDPGVSIVVSRSHGVRGADKGLIHHPVFGDRTDWKPQVVPSGWFERPLQAGAPLIRPELQKALEHMLDRVVREVGRG